MAVIYVKRSSYSLNFGVESKRSRVRFRARSQQVPSWARMSLAFTALYLTQWNPKTRKKPPALRFIRATSRRASLCCLPFKAALKLPLRRRTGTLISTCTITSIAFSILGVLYKRLEVYILLFFNFATLSIAIIPSTYLSSLFYTH